MFRVRRAACLLITMSAFSCGKAISWLPSGEARSAILLFERENDDVRIDAFDLEAEPVLSELQPSEEAKVFALLYRDRLSEIGLPNGRLTRSDSGGRLPAKNRRTYEGTFSSDSFVWTEAILPDRLQQIRLAELEPCRRRILVQETTIPHPAVEVFTFVEPIGPEGEQRGLLGTSNGRFFVVERDGTWTEQTQLSTNTPHWSALYDPKDDEIRLAGKKRVARGSLEKGFTEVESLNVRDHTCIGGGQTPTGVEVFAANIGGAVARLDGAHWSVLAETTPNFPVSRCGIAWTGPGRAFAFPGTEDSFVYYDDGEVEVVPFEEQGPQLNRESIHWLGMIPELGPFLGSRTRLYQIERKSLSPLPHAPTPNKIYNALRIDQGILFGGETGIFHQYHNGFGYCAPEVYAFTTVTHSAFVDDVLLLVEEHLLRFRLFRFE